MLRLILPLCDDRCVTDMALKSSKNLDWERIIYKAWPFPAKGPKLLPNPFGHSSWPDPKKFAYTFDHCAEIMNRFTEALGFHHYTLYIQDYGGPVGFRMALAHPDRVEALIIQNAVAHNDVLGEIWGPRRAFWADRAANEGTLRRSFLSFETTRGRHIGSDPQVDRYDPDQCTDEFNFPSKPRPHRDRRSGYHAKIATPSIEEAAPGDAA